MTKEDLENLKQEYANLQRKYFLPTFDELNEDFQIEKLSETATDFLLREIRRLISDRLFNYLRFIESLLNPVNVPMFVYSVIKTFNSEEKEKLTEMYKKLARREVELIKLDMSATEEEEVGFIKDSYKLWQEMKTGLLGIVGVIKKNWDAEPDVDKKNYFG